MYTRSTADEFEGEGAFIEGAPNPCVPRCKVTIFFNLKIIDIKKKKPP